MIEVDLKNCSECSYKKYNEKKVKNYKDETAVLKSGSSQSEQSFFPLAIDDYFMAVAILTGSLKKSKVNMHSGQRICQHYTQFIAEYIENTKEEEDARECEAACIVYVHVYTRNRDS